MKKIITKSLSNSINYETFRELVSKLLQENKSTGKEQSNNLLNYSILNDRRMKRLDKTIKITPNIQKRLQKAKGNYIFLVLMEGWCGDGAQTLPLLNKIVSFLPNTDLKIALRDQNDDLMNQFLTNGGKAIPKLIILNKKDFTVLANWGPRPSTATKMVLDYKEKNGSLNAEFKKNLQIWYNKDKGNTTQKDIVELIQKIENAS